MEAVLNTTKNADLTNFSTLRTVAFAEELALPKTIEDSVNIFKHIKANNLEWNILGAGSNSLLSSRAIPGLTVCMTSLDFLEKIDEHTYEVGAGMRMPRFCALMAREALSGAEFMEGIPGTIGGGIVMNAGAHGSEISKILKSAKLLDLETLELKELSREDLNLTYRSSKIDPKKHVLLSGTFELKADEKEAIRERIATYNSQRTSHQPIKAWTCGCTFKNPSTECRAGQLIDELGAKGLSVGPFHVSMKHGNFFENDGKGTSMEFCQLMSQIQKLALEKRSVILQPEVKRIGEFSPEENSIWS